MGITGIKADVYRQSVHIHYRLQRKTPIAEFMDKEKRGLGDGDIIGVRKSHIPGNGEETFNEMVEKSQKTLSEPSARPQFSLQKHFVVKRIEMPGGQVIRDMRSERELVRKARLKEMTGLYLDTKA
jgi:hypothetical protein